MENKEEISLAAAAKIAGVSYSKVKEWVLDGTLKGMGVKRIDRYLIFKKDFEKWVKENTEVI